MSHLPGASTMADKALAPSELYWLDLLLTADPVHAEVSMLQALPCLTRSPASFRTYIGQAIDFVRAELNASIERANDLSTTQRQVASEANETENDHERLARAILAMDAFPRCAVVLRLAGKMTMSEIGACLRVSTQLVKQALATGLVTLNSSLQAHSASGIQTLTGSTR